MSAEIMHGDCLEVMQGMADNSVDSIVTDPPYGLSFMGKKWDHDVPSEAIWREALRVLKPGGHLLSFFGSRTYHRGVVRIEDAGFEIRDQIMWVFGSGFPKSLDVSKTLDKAAGAEREVLGPQKYGDGQTYGERAAAGRSGGAMGETVARGASVLTAPATDAAKQWAGFGTALKPSFEPIVLARKPLVGTVAQNVLAHGTGALNIDGCRIEASDKAIFPAGITSQTETVFGGGKGRYDDRARTPDGNLQSRWPANFIHDGSDEVLALFPETKSAAGVIKRAGDFARGLEGRTDKPEVIPDGVGFGDSGSAARFFYCAKASRSDRGEGNLHPTVKPSALMRYLVRLITPPGGTVLDPFCGSGSTGKAAVLEGFAFIGIELDAEYVEIARARIANAQPALLETA